MCTLGGGQATSFKNEVAYEAAYEDGNAATPCFSHIAWVQDQMLCEEIGMFNQEYREQIITKLQFHPSLIQ